jgi:hypothetical protein
MNGFPQQGVEDDGHLVTGDGSGDAHWEASANTIVYQLLL